MSIECQQFHAIHASLQPTPEPWGRVEEALNVLDDLQSKGGVVKGSVSPKMKKDKLVKS